MGIPHSSPEDCQTSAEAYEIANRMMTFGNAEYDSTGDEFTVGACFNAASFFNEAKLYFQRGDELAAQGK